MGVTPNFFSLYYPGRWNGFQNGCLAGDSTSLLRLRRPCGRSLGAVGGTSGHRPSVQGFAVSPSHASSCSHPRKDVNCCNVIPKGWIEPQVMFCTLKFGILKIRFQPLCRASLNILAMNKISFWNPPLRRSPSCFLLSRKPPHGADQKRGCALARPCGPRARDPRGVTGPPGSVPRSRVRSDRFHLLMLCMHWYSFLQQVPPGAGLPLVQCPRPGLPKTDIWRAPADKRKSRAGAISLKNTRRMFLLALVVWKLESFRCHRHQNRNSTTTTRTETHTQILPCFIADLKSVRIVSVDFLIEIHRVCAFER